MTYNALHATLTPLLLCLLISFQFSGCENKNSDPVPVDTLVDTVTEDQDTQKDSTDQDLQLTDSIQEEPEIIDTYDFRSELSEAQSGEFSLLSYNVAGLPEGMSSSNPEINSPQISPLLNAYDLVLLQEDFWYHDLITGQITTLPFWSDPMWETPDLLTMGDGLNRFSIYPFEEFLRVTWEECNGRLDHGSDCLTTKGFSFAKHWLAQDVVIHVYNLHMDAGGSEGDNNARAVQVEQLLEFINSHSEDQAIIVAGDSNMRFTDPEDVEPLNRLFEGSGLTDVCHALECGSERIDRITFRSSEQIILLPTLWETPANFLTPEGEPLSDHDPLVSNFSWSLAE